MKRGPTHGRMRARVPAAMLALLATAVVQSPVAGAQGPLQLTITQPLSGSITRDPTPTFSGTTTEALTAITLRVYAGDRAEGTALQTLTPLIPASTEWSESLPTPLPDGQYTAQGEDVSSSHGSATSAAIAFTVDTTPPVVTLNPIDSPTNDATPFLSGAAGVAEGDAKSVTVTIYAGTSVAGASVARVSVPVTAGRWQYVSAHLGDGVYTAQSTQVDEAGNTGASTAIGFNVDTTPPALTTTRPTSATLTTSRPSFGGSAGTAGGDEPWVTLSIFAGAAATGTPVEARVLSAAEWAAGVTGGPLPNGQYTALAEQSDEVGNVARSTVTFTLSASPPGVTLALMGAITRGGGLLSAATPSFQGTAGSGPEDGSSVVVQVYAGASATGTPVATATGQLDGGSWSAGPLAALARGTYTAVAEQQDGQFFGHGGTSGSITFEVDDTPPPVTVESPSPGAIATGPAVAVAGAAGAAELDVPLVTVALYAGAADTGTRLEAVIVPAAAGSWHATFDGLAAGLYTVVAQQGDELGNIGTSATTTFTVAAPVTPPVSTPAQQTPVTSLPSSTNQALSQSTAAAGSAAAPPSASFLWFPREPHAGEPVTLVSTSGDPGSAITGYAWGLSAQAPFTAGPASYTTSFAAPGAYRIRLRVTNAVGKSTVVENDVEVSSPALTMMQPFPVVRIAGTDRSGSIHVRLLSVLAPPGAIVEVTCRGRGCPARSQTVQVSARARSTAAVTITLRRFETALPAGVVLEIRVLQSGHIGKYTRLVVRRGKLPLRVDSCVSPQGSKPMTCPY